MKTTLDLTDAFCEAKTPETFAKPDPFDVANIRLQLEANRRKANQRDETRELNATPTR